MIPTYNVATYLPEFLNSLDAQQGDLSLVELIFVNDGSTDESPDLIRQWMATARIATRLIEQPNGGLSAARNSGLDVAVNQWVCFCDPDDILTPKYLSVMAQFAASDEAQDVQIIAGNFVYLNDEDNTRSNTHPLRFRFSEGNRVVDLTRHPHFIHVAANTGLFRRDLLNEFGLRYDGRVEPVWEDGHLTCLYLSHFDHPRIAMMADAVYLYRRRSDGSSLMQGSWAKPGKYLSVPRFGWLDVVHRVHAKLGYIPPWIQNIILYDMTGYFRQEMRSPSPTGGVSPEISEEFYSIVAQVMEYIDAKAIEGYRVSYIEHEVREAMRLGLKHEDPRPRVINIDKLDAARGLVRLHYYYTGADPIEDIRARGFRCRPVYAKTRSSKFYGRALMYERTLWLAADGGIEVSLDGVLTPLVTGSMRARQYLLGPTSIWPALAGRKPPPKRPRRPPVTLRAKAGAVKRRLKTALRPFDLRQPRQRMKLSDRVTVTLSKRSWARHKYHDAWLLIDRDTQAGDNAEHLYRYLQANQPTVNAWFVLSRTSSDWPRLAAEGFRLIEYGTREHKIALLNCVNLLSSQIDNYITNPLHAYRFGKAASKWNYTFLQHGVTKDDLSIWINSKPISLMIAATPDEQNLIVGDKSTYLFSEREIKLTGFPRHDRLNRLARDTATAPNKVLIMPTWRRNLLVGEGTDGNRRSLRTDFWQSDYACHWRAVVESAELHRQAAAHGWEIVFVPHPNMQDYLDASPLAPYVKVHKFTEIDVQELLVSGAMLVTDYSSLAFEMAYLERPVVYFQFDQEAFFDGTHAYRRGSWSYEKDGFGPVTTDSESAVAAITATMRRGGTAEPEYAERITQTFPFRDGQCCARTFEAVRDITRPLTYEEKYLRLPADGTDC